MSELSKNKKLKKLYDFGDRITPQKWAKAMDILSPYSPPEDAPVINTTYAEAKALYESNLMRSGVYYEFRHNYERYYLMSHDDGEKYNTDYTHNIDIKVFLLGDTIKATGIVNGYSFIADYSFDSDIVNVMVEHTSYNLYDSLIFKHNNSLLYYTNSFDPSEGSRVDVLLDLIDNLDKYNISYSLEQAQDFGEDEDLYWETISKNNINDNGERYIYKITILDDAIVYTYNHDGSDDKILFKNNLLFQCSESNSYKWSISESNITHNGSLSNLDFGDFKHSYLIGGFFRGDVDIRLDHFVKIDNSNARGYIKDSNITGHFNGDYPTLIIMYSSYDNVNYDKNVVVLSNIVLQDLSSGDDEEEGWEE